MERNCMAQTTSDRKKITRLSCRWIAGQLGNLAAGCCRAAGMLQLHISMRPLPLTPPLASQRESLPCFTPGCLANPCCLTPLSPLGGSESSPERSWHCSPTPSTHLHDTGAHRGDGSKLKGCSRRGQLSTGDGRSAGQPSEHTAGPAAHGEHAGYPVAGKSSCLSTQPLGLALHSRSLPLPTASLPAQVSGTTRHTSESLPPTPCHARHSTAPPGIRLTHLCGAGLGWPLARSARAALLAGP